MNDPQTANEYEDRSAQAVYSVLVEIGQVLGAYRDRMVIIGGSVPWLLFPQAEPRHIGTIDVDLSLDAEALGDGEYKTLIDLLADAGYELPDGTGRLFQLRRTVTVDEGLPVVVVIDLMMPREARYARNKPPLLANFAVQRADGAGVAMRNNTEIAITGRMPSGIPNQVRLRVATVPALLVMKGHAISGRQKPKDAYDIYFVVKQFEGGPAALAEACRPLMGDELVVKAYKNINEKFQSEGFYGPLTVRRFLEESDALGPMTPDQVQTDAYFQVRAWLDHLFG